jgi:hypothetical protein
MSGISSAMRHRRDRASQDMTVGCSREPGKRFALRRDDQPPVAGAPRQLAAKGIVDVDDARGEARPIEQLRLGRRVGFHRAVVVQMIAREIGESGRVETHAADARLIERVRGNLHRDACRAVRAQLRELPVNAHRVRRRVRALRQRARLSESERADVARAPSGDGERLREQVGAGRLAVRARDAGDRQGE